MAKESFENRGAQPSDKAELPSLSGQTDMFVGTAEFYAKYRPGYCSELLDKIIELSSPDGTLLDLGCGTGQLAVPLASHFREVLAVDPDPDMIAQGRQFSNAENVQWKVGNSAELAALLKNINDLNAVSMGRSFHWMNREEVLAVLHEKLLPDGRVFLIGETTTKTSPCSWRDLSKQVITKYLGEDRKAGTTGRYEHPKKKHQEVIAESSFGEPKIINFQTERKWDVSSILGYLYSTSFCSIPVLGDKKDDFEHDLQQQLLLASSDGTFVEQVEEELIVATKITGKE